MMSMNEQQMKEWYFFARTIEKVALLYSPDKLAHYIYYRYKSSPALLYSNVSMMAIILKRSFDWDEDKIEEFEEEYKSLMKYTKIKVK